MKKLLVETTGKFMFLDSQARQEIQSHRPSVVVASEFVSTRMGRGELKLLSNELQEESTDKEFNVYFLEAGRDKELAVASFLSKFAFEKKEEALPLADLTPQAQTLSETKKETVKPLPQQVKTATVNSKVK